ncbi:TerD family protein [Nocardioides sp. URHA0032]|uniref:TerD family protein n=1 Tax=Nocardioides sp. URHA0032 TaxID=1380388 RepID=UPI0006883E38|nr:TerD family protein [Nocardioides sp. URHA0032]
MIELTRDQELALATEDGAPVTRIRMGLGWDKSRTAGAAGSGLPDIDLDASAVQFAGDQLFDLAFYNNLTTRDGSVVHLGDNQTGRGEGDDEAITVDLPRVHGPVDTVFFMVSSYQGHTLEWIHRAYCRIVDEERDVELARFTITNGVPETGLAMAKLVRDGSGWKLVTIGRGIAVKVPSESTAKLRPFL